MSDEEKLPERIVVPTKVRVLPMAMHWYADHLKVGDVLDVKVTSVKLDETVDCSLAICRDGVRMTVGQDCDIVEAVSYIRQDLTVGVKFCFDPGPDVLPEGVDEDLHASEEGKRTADKHLSALIRRGKMSDAQNLPEDQAEPPDESERRCQSCRKPGRQQFDNGLKCGIYCNPCFLKMIGECRSRSW